MKLQFNLPYFIYFVILLIAEICIGCIFTSGFIRHTFGDYLVVILLYCFFKSFINSPPINIAIGVLLIAYTIEFLQGLHLLTILNLEHNTIAKLLLGSTFHITDLIAYTLGIATVLLIELKYRSK